MKKTFLPEEFKKKYSKIMGNEKDSFFEYCCKKISKSIWVNSLKINPRLLEKELKNQNWKLTNLFHENAFAIEGITRPGQSEQFKQGLFNLQEKSSMLPALILAPKKEDLVLDATSAPGNKTLQMACLMQGKGKIIAVEKNVKRFKSLNFNVKKFGIKNIILKRMDLLDAKKKNLFDKILLDSPCSSEGLVRMKFDALKEWTPEIVEKKSELQKKLITKAIELLKENGELVYSTCSLSPEENEEVIQHAIDHRKIEVLKIELKKIKTRKGLEEYNGKKFDSQIKKTIRIYPQDNDSQAFFIAKLKKIAT